MKERIFSMMVYILNLTLLCCPWIPFGKMRYNYLSFSVIAWSEEFEQMIMDAGVSTENVVNLIVGTRAELIFLGISVVLSGTYLVLMSLGKYRKVNFLNTGCLLCVLIMHCSWETLANFCNGDLIGVFVPSFLFLISLVECIFHYIMMDWDKIQREVQRNKKREEELKAEEKERLAFDGKYPGMFYRILRKNFWRNCKDFILLLLCNTMFLSFLIVGFGLKQILSKGNTSTGTLLFNGLDQILVNAFVPLAIISGTVIIILLFYYFKCRAKGYSLFMTLGMRRGLFYAFIAIELAFCLLLSVILGSILGKILLSVMVEYSRGFVGNILAGVKTGVIPYMQAILVLLGLYIVSLLATHEIFFEFNVGKTTDLRVIAEKIPMRSRYVIFVAGIFSIIYCIIQYSKRWNFENKYLILLFFVGLFIVIRYGLVNRLLRERRERKYLKKLMMHHQLLHQSKTSAGYITVFAIIQFCIMFYFSFPVFSAMISDEADELFPYDFVCLADESDRDCFEKMKRNYGVEFYEFPMVRVSAFDSTEQNESVMHQGNPIQGQHIGISESTYHELKHMIDKMHEPKDLGLSKSGRNIYIVYQQDQSVKAQPTAFWAPRNQPLLHIGLPCSGIDITFLHRRDIGYENYEVVGEESGSLIGVFKQGIRENIIVFSDEYFEEIKDLWKTTHIIFGGQIEKKEERIENLTVYQGVTRLVLIRAKASDIPKIAKEMEKFENQHFQKEEEAYVLERGIYDKSVSYCYVKDEAVNNISTERYMKIVMNTLLSFVFLFMFLILFIIKMLSEKEMNCYKLSFLTCMGMRKKERVHLIRKELFYYFYCLPTGIAGVFSWIFMNAVFQARLYSPEDMKKYLRYFVPAAGIYLLIVSVGIWISVSGYAKYIETKCSTVKTI